MAFAPSVALGASTKPALGSSKFVTPLPSHSDEAHSTAPTMALRVGFARKSAGVGASSFGGMAKLYSKADTYMAKSILSQYLHMTNASGVYGVTCTEGSVKGAAEGARIRAENITFRNNQKSASKKYGDMYEYRKQAVVGANICSYETKLYCNYSKISEMYYLANSEALGNCSRYATPESAEEAAMVRYMDIQQKIAVNSSGVYSPSCNEGACKGQAEDLRVASLAAAYRNGMKSKIQVLAEKYNQRRHGYVMTRGCSYEDDLITSYPALGASMRSKATGY